MKITKQRNDLVISFVYNPVFIQKLRNFRSRKFDNKTKNWKVPISQVKSVLDALLPLGFLASNEVRDLYDKETKIRRKTKRLLAGQFKESEKELLKNTNMPLFDFQKIGVGFLCANTSALSGDEPGLGKTIQSLAVADIAKAKKILVFCPSALKFQWEEEIKKWIPNKTINIIHGTREERNKRWKKDANFYIVHYELLHRDFEIMELIEWDLIIADEATRISNPKAKQTKLIKKLKAKRRIALKRTPFSNSVQNKWSIIEILY